MASIIVLLLGLVPIASSGVGALQPAASASPELTASATPTASTVAIATEPPPTPEGTPAPQPTAAVDTNASASVKPPAKASPTATAQPGLWRVEGYVVDDSGSALANVCVVVGPHGCQKYSPHTDERGHYFLDVAATTDPPASFDFYFEMPGRETIWWHFTPTGPIEFNVVLKPSHQ